jgi:hypothetical protein
MAISDFTEKQIREKLLSKIKPTILRGSKHQKGIIYLGDLAVARVKIPNSHNRIMKPSKSQYIATSLRLEDDEFNDLIECPLTGPQYYKKLKDRVD